MVQFLIQNGVKLNDDKYEWNWGARYIVQDLIYFAIADLNVEESFIDFLLSQPVNDKTRKLVYGQSSIHLNQSINQADVNKQHELLHVLDSIQHKLTSNLNTINDQDESLKPTLHSHDEDDDDDNNNNADVDVDAGFEAIRMLLEQNSGNIDDSDISLNEESDKEDVSQIISNQVDLKRTKRNDTFIKQTPIESKPTHKLTQITNSNINNFDILQDDDIVQLIKSKPKSTVLQHQSKVQQQPQQQQQQQHIKSKPQEQQIKAKSKSKQSQTSNLHPTVTTTTSINDDETDDAEIDFAKTMDTLFTQFGFSDQNLDQPRHLSYSDLTNDDYINSFDDDGDDNYHQHIEQNGIDDSDFEDDDLQDDVNNQEDVDFTDEDDENQVYEGSEDDYDPFA